VPGIAWIALWVGLVLLALAVYAWIGVRLWRAGRALMAELGAATDRLHAAASTFDDSSRPLARQGQPGRGDGVPVNRRRH
jgi:hypothetical protein